MSGVFRSVLAAGAAALTASVLVGPTTAVLQGARQAPAAAAPMPQAAAPTAAQLAPFLGDWVVNVSLQSFNVRFVVSVKNDGGTPTAVVTSPNQPPVTVTNVSASGSNLVLKYATPYQGQMLSTVLVLTPDAPGLRADMAVMDGQYEMTGSAVRPTPGVDPLAAAASPFQGGAPDQTSPATDFSPKPPYTARTPEEEAAGFRLPVGYRLELVASDPDVISPAVIEFDGNGRMYVSELVSYMMDADASREHDPISRISRWESTRHDGHFDKHTIFVDHVVAPRMILPLQDGVILTSETDSDDLVKWSDTDGDGVADKREVVFTGIGQSGDANIEHQKAGLVWGLDNWIYTTYNPFRIRWTPSGFLKEPTGPNGGQWGLGADDDGKMWFVDAGGERGPMNFQYPIEYGAFTPCPAPGRRGGAAAAPNPNCPPGMENGFEKDFAVVWPPRGIGDMQGGIDRTRMPAENLNHFTAATGPAIVRGDRLPADLEGDLLFTEPVGRLIRRAHVANVEGLTELRNAYPGSEFITSEDQLFRPVNISNAPDGTVYIADMYHGIIQEREWSGPGTYLRAKIEQYQLDKVVGHGRIWRLRYDGRPAVEKSDTNIGQAAIPGIEPDFTPPNMYNETPAQLVAHLSHPNGWWRDMAQRLLVLKQDKSVVPALEAMLRGRASTPGAAAGAGRDLLGRFHALWTLEGLGALDPALVRTAMKDANPRLRIQAIRASETLYKAGDKSFADDYRALTKDPDPNVAIQAMLTVNLFKLPDAADVIKAAAASNHAKGVALVSEHLLAPSAASFARRGAALSPEEEARYQKGSDIFGGVCFSCHGTDGRGTAMEGAAAGTMLAPPLAGSPRVQGHRDYVIKVLLKGLTGPIEGKTYKDVMVPMGQQDDEWVAAVASYVRNSFGNSAGMVTPADVARVRAETAARKTPWTVPELEASLPRLVDPAQLAFSASHDAAAAAGAASLRGWTAGAPQAAGQWFQIEMKQPGLVTELQFESTGTPPGSPRAFRVQTSTDGRTWSRPVAEGTGTGGRTTIRFAPTRARFVRITLTDAAAGGPVWSIRNLRVYQAAPR